MVTAMTVEQYVRSYRISGEARAGRVLWFLGYPNQALARVTQALAQANEMNAPPRIAYCLFSLVRLHMHRREVEQVHDHL